MGYVCVCVCMVSGYVQCVKQGDVYVGSGAGGWARDGPVNRRFDHGDGCVYGVCVYIGLVCVCVLVCVLWVCVYGGWGSGAEVRGGVCDGGLWWMGKS